MAKKLQTRKTTAAKGMTDALVKHVVQRELQKKDWTSFLKTFHADLTKRGEEEARRQWREEQNLIYVKTYTVHEHFRVRRSRKTQRKTFTVYYGGRK